MTDLQDKPYQLRFINSIAEVEAAHWNQLIPQLYPFLRHEFLLALELSGCTTEQSGWKVCHALIEDKQSKSLLGFLPLFLKTNSFGEYVFDWSWADAYKRHGLTYYPKLLSAIPFTPCAGPRLCLDPSVNLKLAKNMIIEAIREMAEREKLSSWHLLFPDNQQKEQLNDERLILRTGCQFQWFNSGFSEFEDFLATLSSRKRKNMRKERRRVEEQGISFTVLEGHMVTEDQWQLFYQFYENTYLVRGRPPYLNLSFFLALAKNMPEQLILVLANKDGVEVAGALFFKAEDTLFGRYWGCSNEYQFLHFETCYYQGIDYCIKHQLQRFDSGAQGEHKIQRGFKPISTWSLHWIEHPEFSNAIRDFVKEEAVHIQQYIDSATEFLPFRKDLDLANADNSSKPLTPK